MGVPEPTCRFTCQFPMFWSWWFKPKKIYINCWKLHRLKTNSPPLSHSSSHLICLVAQPYVPPLQVNLVHGDPPAGWGLLGDASARHGAPCEAGGLAVGVVRAPPLGRRAAGTEVDRTGVSSGRRWATSCHFGGRWARRQTQSAGTQKVNV